MDNFISVKGLAKKMNMPEWTIRDYARKKIFPAYKIGGRIVFIYEEVVKNIKKNKI